MGIAMVSPLDWSRAITGYDARCYACGRPRGRDHAGESCTGFISPARRMASLVTKRKTKATTIAAAVSVLTSHANYGSGTVQMGRRVLGELAGLSEATVGAALDALQLGGFLELVDRGSGAGGKVSTYRLTIPEIAITGERSSTTEYKSEVSGDVEE